MCVREREIQRDILIEREKERERYREREYKQETQVWSYDPKSEQGWERLAYTGAYIHI